MASGWKAALCAHAVVLPLLALGWSAGGWDVETAAHLYAGFIAALYVATLISSRANSALRDSTSVSKERFRNAFEAAPIGMAIMDPSGTFNRVNRAFSATTGYTIDELVGMKLEQLVPKDAREEYKTTWAQPDQGELERRFVRKDGAIGWGLWQRTTVSDGSFLLQCLDISTRKEVERQLELQARHDSLTGLPNRSRFIELLRESLGIWSRQGRSVAVLFLDLDNFKVINDSLGHRCGDRLLMETASRIEAVLRAGDSLARFGGDEFTICLGNLADEDEAVRVTERLLEALRAPVVLDDERRYITASVGLTLASDADEDVEALLRDADAAMYRAKELGKARCVVFDDSMRQQAVERLELETTLRGALERGELRLVYQPKVELAGERIVGVEALLRWDHPTHGTIPPLKFIPLAEQSGLIVPIGAWVVREACRALAHWQAEFDRSDLVIAVNLSPRQLGSCELVPTVAEVLRETGVAPETLCLEVTESALMTDVAAAADTLSALKALGVRLAVDDFGVGHASLKQLKELLPVDVLKIDKSFVDGLTTDLEDRAIVEAVIILAASLGLDTVAEGVEHAEQAAALRDLHCRLAQGYHFSRPVQADAISALLDAEPVPTPTQLAAGDVSLPAAD